MNRTSSTTAATELTSDQMDAVRGGLNALTVVAAIGLTLAVDVAKAGTLVAVGGVKANGALQ